MSLKTVMKGLWYEFRHHDQPPARTIEVDYKNLPAEVAKQLSRDALNVGISILQEKLPTIYELELITELLRTVPNSPLPGAPTILRKLTEGVKELQRLFEQTTRDQKENPILDENSLLQAKAAPKMLQALKDIRGWREAPDTFESMEYIQDVANKAICLATGEEYVPPKFPLKF